MTLINYYKILDIHEDATPPQVKEAYKRLAKFWHPDVNSSSESHERFVLINEAYQILGNDDKRQVFDRLFQEYCKSPGKRTSTPVKNDIDPPFGKKYNEEDQSRDFNNLQDWIKQSQIVGNDLINRGFKHVDRSIESGFHAVNIVGNILSIILAFAFLATIGYKSLKYIYGILSGTRNISAVGLILSIAVLLFCLLAIIGWAKIEIEKGRSRNYPG